MLCFLTASPAISCRGERIALSTSSIPACRIPLKIQMLFEAQVSSGRSVQLLEVHISETYECLLEGSISARTNDFVLRSVVTEMIWPGIPARILGSDAYE